MQYDSIIIGAGLGSLTTAALLAKAGQKVAVFEKNNTMGGAAGAFHKDGYLFDRSLHNFGPYYENTAVYDLFEELDITEKLIFITFPFYQKLIFPGKIFTPERGIDNFISTLTESYPDEAKGIKKIMKIAGKLFAEFNEFQKLRININEIDEKLPGFPLEFPNIVFLASKTVDAFFKEYVSNSELQGILGNLWWLFGIPPDQLSAVLYLAPLYGYFRYGGGIFEGTSRSLVAALSDYITTHGGDIITDTAIQEITINQNGHVSGVILADGRCIAANTVISGAGASSTFTQLLKQPASEQNRLSTASRSLSAVALYAGLDCPPEEIGITEHAAALFGSFDHHQNYTYSLNNDFENSTLLFFCPSLYDKTLCATGTGIIHLLTLCDPQKEIIKNAAEDILLDRMEQRYPEIRKHITSLSLLTPDEIKEYTGEASLYGYAQTTEFSGVNRLPSTTSIPGLYITGKDTFPGAGYPSVITAGALCAKMVLKPVTCD